MEALYQRQIEAVYQRALLLRQHAIELPVQPDLLKAALKELHFVLEELQTAQEELCHQNQELLATQHAVDRERQRYQALFELAPDGYLLTDQQGKIHQANRAAANLFSIPQEYLVNKPLVVLIDESDRPLFQTRLANLNPMQDWELSLSPRNGVQRSVAVSVAHINGSQGENALLWSFRDITLRKQMEQQLQAAHNQLEHRVEQRTAELSATTVQLQQKIDQQQQAEQKIKEQAALLDIATDAILVQDLDYRILFWSKGAERLYGWSTTDTLGRTALELLYRKPAAQFIAGFNQTIEQGAWQGELEQVSQTGKLIIVASRWTLVHDRSGNPQSILVVNTDITEKKQLEAQFYRSQRLESMGILASGIAHDLNNTLTPILTIAQLMRLHQSDLNEQTQEMLQILESSARRGADMVKQITTFVRGTDGKRILLQVAYLLQDIVKIARQTFPKSIEIRKALPDQPLWLVSADPTQLHQVFMNLCVNARDAMADGGILTLSGQNCCIDETAAQANLDARVGDYVLVTISDTGTGIPEEIRDRIFDPFFTTKELGKGTGLGLSTSLGIIKSYGGFLQVVSDAGTGTQVKLYLPVAEGAPTQSGQSAQLHQGNGELMLIVDDDRAVQSVNQTLLESYGCKTLAANDGQEAIALYSQHQDAIKLVLMDVMMPNLDGVATIHILKQINPQVKIVAISGLLSNRDTVLEAGADRFLTKPYAIDDLVSTLYDLINGNSPSL